MSSVLPGTINGDGVLTPSYPAPSDSIENWSDGVNFYANSRLDFCRPGGVTSPKGTIKNVFNGSRTIDGSFFNLHLFDIGAGIPTDIDYYGVRLHDTKGPKTGEGLRWHNIDKVSGYDWSNLDIAVDLLASAGKNILYTVIGTPDRYASGNPGNGKYDGGTGNFTGSNQVPSASGLVAWENFATALATRYNGGAHGRIATYEIYNEVNYSSYWAGSAAQYANLLRLFRNAVKAVDNTLKVGAPTIQEPEGTGTAWLTTFLAAADGATGTGKDNMDYCFCHLYPPKYNFGVAEKQVDLVRNALDAVGKTSLDIWNTETGILFDPSRPLTDDWKAKMLSRTLALCAAKGIKRYYWYAYDNPLMSMSSAEKTAWQDMRNLLIGNQITNCNVLADERVCISVAGKDYIF